MKGKKNTALMLKVQRQGSGLNKIGKREEQLSGTYSLFCFLVPPIIKSSYYCSCQNTPVATPSLLQ